MNVSYAASVAKQWNIPNTLSLSRVILGVTVFFWWQFDSWLTLTIIIIAGLSDGLDGWLARQLKQRTPLGVQLDPLADKMFVLPAFWYLAVTQQNPFLYALAVVTTVYDFYNTLHREIPIRLALKGYDFDFPSGRTGVTWVSKAKTSGQFMLLMYLVFMPITWLTTTLVLTLCGLTILSWLLSRLGK